MELKHGVVSADDHVQEHPEVWTSRMSRAKWGDRIPHLARMDDGSEEWMIEGWRIPLYGVALANAAMDDRAQEPKRWNEVPRAVFSAAERLKAMDIDGIDYSVLYPSVSGFAGQIFGGVVDPDLEIACVQAYNDWLIEEWAGVSPRFVPQCIVPIWPMDWTVAEINRAVKKGHKGVIYPASPMELRRVPHINDPAYDPLWATCQDLGVPLCFHAGGSAKIQMLPGSAFKPAVAAAFSDVVRSVSSIAVVANFLLARVLDRFPRLKVVFAESSIGWGAYELEYADYQSAADGLPSEGYDLKPSELFQRQCYFTCWYDRMSFRARRHLGTGNILWSSHFPLASSTWPDTRRHLESALAGVPADEKRQIQWENAAKLYRL
ncbi:MAG TPA: amidohydrolase family protein [Candidatus Binatia bacterium]|nr:amidohydrolase family protein [Candidatus Binatia bacterium]